MISPWYYRYAPWLLTALVFFLLVPGTARLPLIDRDEPRFATATREMIQRSDWIVPTFNGHERFDKPVLTYWLMRAGYSIFGFTEFGARVHAILATLALVLLTWWVGRRWWSEAVGLWSAVMLASCLQVYIHGRLALADMPMIACVMLACVALKELLSPRPGIRFYQDGWWWALYLALGVGFLAKGPIVFAVPVLALVIYRLVLWRRPLDWSRLGALPGLVLTLAIIAAWGIPALVVTEGRFWKVGMGEHVVHRGYDGFNGRGYSPFFYAATAPVSLFPWVALLGFLPWIVRRNWNAQTAWLVAWMAAPYVIFTAYATQLPHYVLPAFPAIFLLLAVAVSSERAAWPRGAKRFAWSVLGVFGAVALLGLAVVRVAELPASVDVLRGAMTGVFLVLLGFVLGATALLRRWPLLGLAGLLLLLPGTLSMARGLRQCSLTAGAPQWTGGLPADARCVGAGFSEPSLVFYSRHQWVFPQDETELRADLAGAGPAAVVTLVEEADPLKFFTAGLLERFGRGKPVAFHAGSPEIARIVAGATAGPEWATRQVEGFNLGRTRWQRLRIAVRAGDTRAP